MKRIIGLLLSSVILAGSVAPALADRDYRRDQRQDRRQDRRADRGETRRGEAREWRRYNLWAPARGCEWREIDGRFFLVVVATGLIVAIVAHG